MSLMLRRSRQSRAVTVTYGGVATAILLVVAAVALVVAPPAPPSVAEFAPQATDTIDESPDNQSSRFGAGDGDCAEGQVCEGTTTTVPGDDDGDGIGDDRGDRVIDVKRVRRCVGDPPRQTEDPQSPPCVNYFEGDNGGATAKGVTRDEIRVAFPADNRSEEIELRYYDYLLDHFNSRYELYGRRLRLVPVATAGSSMRGSIEADEKQAFALLPDYSGGGHADLRELQRESARRNTVTVMSGATYATSQLYRELSPYAWSYGPTFDEAASELGRLVCSSLAGRSARFAGPEFRLQTRKFGVLVADERNSPRPDLSPLFDVLDSCDVPRPPVYASPGDAAATYTQMRSDGTNSVLVLTDASQMTGLMGQLPAEFEPEWALSGLVGTEDVGSMRLGAGPKRRNVFGNFTLNKLQKPEDTPAWWAFQEGPGGAHQWQHNEINAGRDPDLQTAYRSLLLLVSGIQMAGPRLTPETFQAGLQKTRFPNPGAGAAPYHQARVGFGPGDFAMVDDVAVVWWSESAPSYGDRNGVQNGGWCYVDKGARFSRRSWVDVESRLFDPDPGACR
jgi:hypothetical protein